MARLPSARLTDKRRRLSELEQHRKLMICLSICALLGALTVFFAEYIIVSPVLKTVVAAMFVICAGFAYVVCAPRRVMEDDETATGEAVEESVLETDALDGQTSRRDPQTMQTVVKLSYTDKLTGLGNKRRLAEKFKTLAANYHTSPPETRQPFAVGVVNLDGMKPINDLFGAGGGDNLIQQCSMRLRAALENQGFVFRHEGDEFSFLLPQAASEEAVAQIGKLLQDVLHAPFDVDDAPVRISGSFGFAFFPEAGGTLDEMMDKIETALYNSKRRGRGRVTIYTSELEQSVRENAVLEQALRRAISENEIKPHFQPIISLQDGSLLGFEALARWIDPELGFVSPAKFIALAEERGIIATLTDALLYQAAKAAADWPADLFLSFNLSSAQLVDSTTAQTILSVIRRAGLPPQRLEIEVTETATMSDPETASAIIEELHEAGVRISMDDFGTGQSSLGRLRELQLDKVKIDRAFIMAIGEDKPAEHIVRAILEMCAGLDLTVVAEGIEEINQAESLKRFGCHAGQGYLFGKPQDATKTMGYIRQFRRIAKSDREAKIA